MAEIDFPKAVEIADEKVRAAQRGMGTSEIELILFPELTITKNYGWVFFYGSRQYRETEDFRYAVAGNAPFLVTKHGDVHVFGTAYPTERYIEVLETRFDMWSLVRRGYNQDAVNALTASRSELRPLEVRRLVNSSTTRDEWLLIARAGLWDEVNSFRAQPPTWCREVKVYQEGGGPADEGLEYCERHQLHYGGCLGCHVCSGFYER